MKLTVLALSLFLLAGCATSNPNLAAYQAYIATNRPHAEHGDIKWSEYYEGLYRTGTAAGMAPFAQYRLNDMIRYAQQYEAGTLTKEEFDYQRRAANAANNADSQAAREREQDRSAAIAATLLAASATMQQAPAPYQVIQPVRLQSSGVTAMHTGRQKSVQTITGQFGYQCEYNYLGKLFTRVFTGMCPSSVQVE